MDWVQLLVVWVYSLLIFGVNSLRWNDDILCPRTWSTLIQIMAFCWSNPCEQMSVTFNQMQHFFENVLKKAAMLPQPLCVKYIAIYFINFITSSCLCWLCKIFALHFYLCVEADQSATCNKTEFGWYWNPRPGTISVLSDHSKSYDIMLLRTEIWLWLI